MTTLLGNNCQHLGSPVFKCSFNESVALFVGLMCFVGSWAWFYDTFLIQPRALIFPFCFNDGICSSFWLSWISCLSTCDSWSCCTGGSLYVHFLSKWNQLKWSHQGQSTGGGPVSYNLDQGSEQCRAHCLHINSILGIFLLTVARKLYPISQDELPTVNSPLPIYIL